MKKLVLVDGNNLIFRSFYATAYSNVIMKNSKGFPTNALYGFINMINKIVKEEKPNYMLVAFDKGKTFRHEKYKDYKAGRLKTPDELKLQIPYAFKVLDALGIKHYEIDDFEADDIIGTLSKKASRNNFNTTIVSSDKDLLQLIDDNVVVKLLKSKDYILMDNNTFYDIYKTKPINMIELKSLMGDSSDNIPGVKGIGEKKAIDLISKYSTIDNLYNNLDELTPKLKEKLIEYKTDAYMSHDLVTIKNDINLEFDIEDCMINDINKDELSSLLNEFEFNSMFSKFDLEKKEVHEKLLYKEIESLSDKDFSYYIETTPGVYSKADIIGIGIYDGNYSYYINKDDIEKYQYLFSNNCNKFTYDLKKSIVLLNKYNININNCNIDIMIILSLLDYIVKDDISFVSSIFNYNIMSYEEVYGTEKRRKDVNIEDIKEDICTKAKFIYDIKNNVLDKLKEENLYDLYKNIEHPLAYVLADMELTGIKVDKKYLNELSVELVKKTDKLKEEIYSLSNTSFNIMSPVQLGDVLFNKLGIEYPKRVKNNKYSTSKDILDKIKDKHEIVEKILEYRTLNKLISNYTVGLIEEVRDDFRIHTIFNQCLTRTGRLSSIEPNLQNIPARGEYAKLIRSAFIPFDDSYLLSSDYSQVELRVFASLSNASNLIDAFNNNLDIHNKTASDIFHVDINEVTSEQRRAAKAVNFGIIYGISSFGLSEDLNIDIKEAKEFIDNYLKTYPGIKDYMDKTIEEAKGYGYVKTLMGRKRVIDEINNANFLIRQSGERMALNTPIQGTAAEIIKKAMVEVYNEFKNKKLKSKILLQVHDELVINVLKDELDIVLKIVKDIMENTYKLQVPLKVEMKYGTNWYEAK